MIPTEKCQSHLGKNRRISELEEEGAIVLNLVFIFSFWPKAAQEVNRKQCL